ATRGISVGARALEQGGGARGVARHLPSVEVEHRQADAAVVPSLLAGGGEDVLERLGALAALGLEQVVVVDGSGRAVLELGLAARPCAVAAVGAADLESLLARPLEHLHRRRLDGDALVRDQDAQLVAGPADLVATPLRGHGARVLAAVAAALAAGLDPEGIA